MGKLLIAAAIAGLAIVAFQTAGDVRADGVVVVNPTNPAPGQPGAAAGGATKMNPQGERGQYGGAYVPPVPVPPGVLGQYSPLPCAVPYAPRAGGSDSLQYLVRELGERTGK